MSHAPSTPPTTAVPAIFLAVAVFLFADPWGGVPPPRPYAVRPPGFADPAPPRTPLLEVPRIRRGRFTYRCVECHRHFQTSDPFRNRTVGEHLDVVLRHGDNDRCRNCHHSEDREALVDHDGSEIAFADVERLCGKCHGPVLRDWRAGVHGRRNGSWNLLDPRMRALKCTACHDPHRPAFQPMPPAPAPRGPDPGTGRPHLPTEVARG